MKANDSESFAVRGKEQAGNIWCLVPTAYPRSSLFKTVSIK